MGKNLNLKSEIVRRGLTQRKLAAMTGIPASYISLSINGRFNLDAGEQLKISEVLNVVPSEIFKEALDNDHGNTQGQRVHP